VQYRSISKLAVLALGLGLASALVLISPLLAPIPLLAIVVAVLGLRGIHASGGQVAGRALAVAGLCLATLFLGWGISARFSRAWTLESRACEFAEAWLMLVAEGDLQQADQLRMAAHIRMRSVAARKEFYEKNPDAQKALETFFAQPAIRNLIAHGKNARFHYDALGAMERSPQRDRVTLRYTIGDSAGGGGQPALLITIKSELEEDHVDWQVENVAGDAGS
jgi:hypothetical protein